MAAPSILPATAEVVFHAEQLTKSYRMGEVEVKALQGIDLDLKRRRIRGHPRAVGQR